MNKLGDAHLFGRGEITAAARSSSLTGSHFRVMPVAYRPSACFKADRSSSSSTTPAM
jgi:hypothetical protein